MTFGLQVVLDVGERDKPEPPPEYFNDIEQFPGEYSSLRSLGR